MYTYATTSNTTNNTAEFTLRVSQTVYYQYEYGYLSFAAGNVDIVLSQGDGRILLRYYYYPIASTATTVGISNSASDYVSVLNLITPSLMQELSLFGTTITFTPINFNSQPYLPYVPAPIQSAVSTYNMSFQLNFIISCPDAFCFRRYIAVFPSHLFPLGFNYTFYNTTYTYVVITPYGLQFNNVSTLVVIPSVSPTIFSFFGLTATQYQTTMTGYGQEFLVRSATVDVVLFEVDGHIEIRLYSIPFNLGPVTLGLSGSLTNFILLIDDASPTIGQIETLRNAVIVATPLQYILLPLISPPTIFNASINSSYTAVVTPYALPSAVPPLAASAVFMTNLYVPELVPIGFIFTFYEFGYTQIVLSDNGNLQFATTNGQSETGVLSAPVIAWFETPLTLNGVSYQTPAVPHLQINSSYVEYYQSHPTPRIMCTYKTKHPV